MAHRGKNGPGEGYRLRSARDQLRPCFKFQQGHCKFGKKCHFSHDTSPINQSQATPPRSSRPPPTQDQYQTRNDYSAWKRLLKHDPVHDNESVLRFWEGALHIQEKEDKEWQQQLAQDLDDDNMKGRQHIEHVMNRMGMSTGEMTSLRISKAFLRVMTHRSFLESLTIDTFVAGLYNFVSGNNGSRAIPYFKNICTILGDTHPDAEDDLQDTLLLAMCVALREIFKREQRARLNVDLPDLLDSMDALAERLSVGNPTPSAHIIVRKIEGLRPVVIRAAPIATDEGATNPISGPSPPNEFFYPLEAVVPQNRHDNDHMDITKIQIFPTRDELMSDVQEALPFADRDQYHFLADPVARHFDTHFRLFRHETFGELKQALSDLMKAAEENMNVFEKPSMGITDIRANHYAAAQITSTAFNRQRGLEIGISFVQPASLRQKSGAERRQWWEESRRLQEGTLLSFITVENGKANTVFLTVHKRVTDPEKDQNLTKDRNFGTIIVQLTVLNQKNLDFLLGWSCGGRRGVLIEFSGVLPATFTPVLLNLQQMAQLGILPFHRSILPDKTTRSDTKILDVPAPLYAQGRGFTIPLDAILKENTPRFALSSDSSPEDINLVHRVADQTGLDHGQSTALIAALTREFALIQGPPGTGKSFVGVRIMRVLLAMKDKARLGPVVVV